MASPRPRRNMADMDDLKDIMLRGPRLTLAVAESLTGGRVQARITAISGASEFFLGGMTAYSLDQKVRHLGVSRGLHFAHLPAQVADLPAIFGEVSPASR